ncbi:hypothetical protein GNZ25_22875 [Burkholderia thailandensis]|nr:hypothetical protein A8H35_26575 [Burkholderia thailandensis]AWY66216.1 hypothetical protein A8H36_11740 [Burkholderia thailandensis]MUV24132.1 hypothetical protein [Burkholderia thailandensis]NBJ21819.1 hypothetical protein [Burkholderia thailandensis]NOK55576.1 hypothetical protein [Burkholderia thailandensis]
MSTAAAPLDASVATIRETGCKPGPKTAVRQVNRERSDMMMFVAGLSGPASRRLHAVRMQAAIGGGTRAFGAAREMRCRRIGRLPGGAGRTDVRAS